jgi:hypothetical protein
MPYVLSRKTDGESTDREVLDPLAKQLADGIAEVAKKYQYDGAFLGELNFALTRLIQHLPRSLMATGQSKDETRYWIQAGLLGVLFDVALEYKVRVNQAYEIEQIKKSGDCYDTPYYSRAVEVVDQNGAHVGEIYVNMRRSDATLGEDVLSAGRFVLHVEDPHDYID